MHAPVLGEGGRAREDGGAEPRRMVSLRPPKQRAWVTQAAGRGRGQWRDGGGRAAAPPRPRRVRPRPWAPSLSLSLPLWRRRERRALRRGLRRTSRAGKTVTGGTGRPPVSFWSRDWISCSRRGARPGIAADPPERTTRPRSSCRSLPGGGG
eukprot:scaffold91804_cov30-Phaeocystis_antarctica.AAC.1